MVCANSAVGMPQTGKMASNPVPASFDSRYARISSRKRSPKAKAFAVRTGSAHPVEKPYHCRFVFFGRKSAQTQT